MELILQWPVSPRPQVTISAQPESRSPISVAVAPGVPIISVPVSLFVPPVRASASLSPLLLPLTASPSVLLPPVWWPWPWLPSRRALTSFSSPLLVFLWRLLKIKHFKDANIHRFRIHLGLTIYAICNTHNAIPCNGYSSAHLMIRAVTVATRTSVFFGLFLLLFLFLFLLLFWRCTVVIVVKNKVIATVQSGK